MTWWESRHSPVASILLLPRPDAPSWQKHIEFLPHDWLVRNQRLQASKHFTKAKRPVCANPAAPLPVRTSSVPHPPALTPSAHCWPLLICRGQILEMAYEWLHYHRNETDVAHATSTSSWFPLAPPPSPELKRDCTVSPGGATR